MDFFFYKKAKERKEMSEHRQISTLEEKIRLKVSRRVNFGFVHSKLMDSRRTLIENNCGLQGSSYLKKM